MSSVSVNQEDNLFAQGLQVTSWGKAVLQSVRYAFRDQTANSESLSEVVVDECCHVEQMAGKSGFRHCMLYVYKTSGSTGDVAWLSQDSGPKRELSFSETEAKLLDDQFGIFIGDWYFITDVRPAGLTGNGFEITDDPDCIIHSAIGTYVLGLLATQCHADTLEAFPEYVSTSASIRGKHIKKGDQLVLDGIILKEKYPRSGLPQTCYWQDARITIEFFRDKKGNPIGSQLSIEVSPDVPYEASMQAGSEAPTKKDLFPLEEASSSGSQFDLGYRNDELEFC